MGRPLWFSTVATPLSNQDIPFGVTVDVLSDYLRSLAPGTLRARTPMRSTRSGRSCRLSLAARVSALDGNSSEPATPRPAECARLDGLSAREREVPTGWLRADIHSDTALTAIVAPHGAAAISGDTSPGATLPRSRRARAAEYGRAGSRDRLRDLPHTGSAQPARSLAHVDVSALPHASSCETSQRDCGSRDHPEGNRTRSASSR
jgi:hypothetical protein